MYRNVCIFNIPAAGLFYLAELVEEYTVTAKYIISWTIIVSKKCEELKFPLYPYSL